MSQKTTWKFKIGDSVRVIERSTLTDTQRANINNIYKVLKTCFTDTGAMAYEISDRGVYRYYDNELELATVHDSKLARRLYKNQIERIDEEAGLIYLK